MSLPTTLRPCVSQSAITKVTRLFNGSLSDILNELFQNARRAGASCVRVASGKSGEQHWITVDDDGDGISDPQALLSLGASGWDDRTAAREDPAGMGFFAFAGRKTTIESAHRDAAFKLVIPADGWTGNRALRLNKTVKERGTHIRFDADAAWCRDLREVVAKSAQFFPFTVEHRGDVMLSKDFLKGAELIQDVLGLRIGVFPRRHHSYEPSINFHGVTISHKLPVIAEESGLNWSVKIDVVDAPDLQLVLPARKEVVETPFLRALEEACRRTIFAAITKRGRHSLAYTFWCEAYAFGIMLPDAEAALLAWQAPTADNNDLLNDTPFLACPASILVPDMVVIDAQLLARAMSAAPDCQFKPLCANPAFCGYPWYDALPIISDQRVSVVHDSKRFATGVACTQIAAARTPMGVDHRIDDATIIMTVTTAGAQNEVVLPLDVVVGFENEDFSNLEDATILVTHASLISPDDLAQLLFDMLFECWQDCTADSHESQSRDFEQSALYRAHQLLSSAEIADLARIENAARAHIGWMIPHGHMLTVRLGDTVCSASLSKHETVMALANR